MRWLCEVVVYARNPSFYERVGALIQLGVEGHQETQAVLASVGEASEHAFFKVSAVCVPRLSFIPVNAIQDYVADT